MRPVLFKPDATAFTTNGIGVLNDVTECIVTEALNGEFELNMKILVSDPYFEQIKIGSIIAAIPNNTSGRQAFVVEQITKPIEGECDIYATHIAQHRSKLIPVGIFSATSLSNALTKIASNSLETNPFTLTTDKSSSVDMVLTEPRSFRECLGGKEGSLLDIYGGEYQYDNFNIRLLNHRGRDNGVQILYGKNMSGFNAENDFGWDQSATGVKPYWKDENNVVIGDIQYSQYKDLYPYAKTVTVDFSSDIENQPTKAQLESYASTWINSRGLPVTNISVEINELINENMTVGLGDTVKVINDLYGVNYSSRIISTEFDVLTERYSNVEIGDKKATINDAISDTASSETVVQGTTYTAGDGISIVADVISSFVNTTDLWTNPNPTASYYDTEAIDLSSYRYVLVIFRNSSFYLSAIAEVGGGGFVSMGLFRNYYRTFSVTTTGVAFDHCKYYGTYGTNSTQNSDGNIIPYKIIGIK